MKKKIAILLIFVIFVGCSSQKGGNGNAIPFTRDNFEKWVNRIEKVSRKLEPASDTKNVIINMKKLFRETCEDIGYDFDDTIIKFAKSPLLNSDPYYWYCYNNIFARILNLIGENHSNEIVSNGLLKKETVDKLKIYLTYEEVDKSLIQFLAIFKKKYNGKVKPIAFLEILKAQFSDNGKNINLQNKSVEQICHNSDDLFLLRYQINEFIQIFQQTSIANKSFLIIKNGKIANIKNIEELCDI